MNLKFKCKQCEKDFFDNKHNDRIFCSYKCSHDFRRGKSYEEQYGEERALLIKKKSYHRLSQESKDKISKAFKDKTYEEIMGKEKALIRKEQLSKQFSGEGNPFYNKKHSIQSKKIMSETHQGENNHKWKGGISYYEKKFRREVRKRDNYICMICGIHQEKLNQALDVHHINYNKTLHILQNGISLCNVCHGRIHNLKMNRKYWITFFQSILTEKYNYNYSPENEVIILV